MCKLMLAIMLMMLMGCGTSTHYFYYVGPGFTPDEHYVIKQAAKEWVAKVGDPGELDLEETWDKGQADIVIEGVPIGLDCAGNDAVGCTHFNRIGTSEVFLDTSYHAQDDGTFQHMTEHELGHALGLNHTGKDTVMYKNLNGAPHVTCADVQQFVNQLGEKNNCSE